MSRHSLLNGFMGPDRSYIFFISRKRFRMDFKNHFEHRFPKSYEVIIVDKTNSAFDSFSHHISHRYASIIV